MQFLSDKNLVMQQLAGKTLEKIAKTYPEFYLNHPKFLQYLDVIIKALQLPLTVRNIHPW